VDRNHSGRRRGEAGFTLIDTLMTVAIFGIIAGMAVPLMKDMSGTMRLGQGAREVERELQSARLKAVTSNRPLRVRFNCPAAGQYRMVEYVGTSVDTAADRCVQTKYPYPATDRDPVTLPNQDGPVRQLDKRLSFATSVKALEFEPDGSVRIDNGGTGAWAQVTGTPGATVTIMLGTTTKTITVNGLGKIQIQ
jgi:Tfp pilus assembly protein FimT